MFSKSIKFLIISVFLFFNSISYAHAKVVEYDIDIDVKTVNFSGKNVTALTVGGGIPGPLIKAVIGDTLRITFHNKLDTPTSIHWHGILLPNAQDGVPYLTTKIIAAKTSFTYEYKVIHTGTYWYHSHTGLQEQQGVYGPIIFAPKTPKYKYDEDHIVQLSDWTDESPDDVLRNLKRDGDYYALRKDSVQSWFKVIKNGAVKGRIDGVMSRMGPMDISDIAYDAFLINGKKTSLLTSAKMGKKIRLRIINSAASSYFNMEYAGGAMTVIAADGMNVKPFKVQRLRIAIAETWDVIVDVPARKSYEFRSTSEDGTGYGSIFIGQGSKVFAPDVPKPDPFAMDHSSHDMSKMSSAVDHSAMDHSGHDMSNMSSPKTDAITDGTVIEHLEDYAPLMSLEKTELKNTTLREIKLNLTGSMEDFVWSFNNVTLSEADSIKIRKGEKVRFILKNETMMHHPLHLHGHFFRVLNGKGAYSPLKHTVNVPPMDTVIIEFDANEEKDWFFHCHNLYHMKAGMARVVSYETSTEYTDFVRQNISGDQHWYKFSDLNVMSHMVSGKAWMRNSRNEISVEAEADYHGNYEALGLYKRTFSKFFKGYIGFESKYWKNDHKENIAVIGVNYILPLLIEADLRVDSKGHIKLSLSNDHQIFDRLKFEWEVDTDEEYELGLEYEITKSISLIFSHSSEFGTGAGIGFKF